LNLKKKKKVLLRVMRMASSSNRTIHFEEGKILRKLPEDHPLSFASEIHLFFVMNGKQANENQRKLCPIFCTKCKKSLTRTCTNKKKLNTTMSVARIVTIPFLAPF